MTAKKFTVFWFFTLTLLLALVIAPGCSKDGPTKPPPVPVPDIQTFVISPNDIVPPDSALVTWKTVRTDSLKIFPSGQKLTPVDSGQLYVKPTIPTLYSLVAYGAGRKDSIAVYVTMSALAASIAIFLIEPDTLVDGDSSLVTWKTTQADSIVINQGVGKVNPVDSGQVTIIPINTAGYRAIAYSIYGNDTVTINVRVKKPVLVRTIGGSYYKGNMGASALAPSLNFAVADAGSNFLDNLWINLRVLEGDGMLIPADSVLTNSNGLANVEYNFSGQLGHAVVSANFRDVDTIDVYLRANTIIPGLGGQGQYLLFSENYIDVKNFNGNPNSVDVDPNSYVNYANYESNLNVVFAINDVNQDTLAQDNEDILAILLTSGYQYKTKDSIGIGSSYYEVKAAYGSPTLVEYDPVPPPALIFYYDNIGMIFFTDTVTGNPVDTNETVFEIHVHDFVSPKSVGKFVSDKNEKADTKPHNYSRFRK